MAAKRGWDKKNKSTVAYVKILWWMKHLTRKDRRKLIMALATYEVAEDKKTRR